ncbi:MAG: LAGLIDADG family homing endonuclease [Parcubacteria group bacterium]
MAYVLGFFAADGNMRINKNGGCYIELTSCDRDVLEKILHCLESTHKISARKRNPRWNIIYRVQMGSKAIFEDLLSLGMTPNKSHTLKFPNVPNSLLKHFVRGYFDGDEHVWKGLTHKYDRPNPVHCMVTGFTSGSKNFLSSLKNSLKKCADVQGGSLHFRSRAYRLLYSTINSKKLYKFMYNGNNTLYMSRKKRRFDKYMDIKGV